MSFPAYCLKPLPRCSESWRAHLAHLSDCISPPLTKLSPTVLTPFPKPAKFFSHPKVFFSLTCLPVFLPAESPSLNVRASSFPWPLCLKHTPSIMTSFCCSHSTVTAFILLFTSSFVCVSPESEIHGGTVSLLHPGTETGMGQALDNMDWNECHLWASVLGPRKQESQLLGCCLPYAASWQLWTMCIQCPVNHWWCHFIKKVRLGSDKLGK